MLRWAKPSLAAVSIVALGLAACDCPCNSTSRGGGAGGADTSPDTRAAAGGAAGANTLTQNGGAPEPGFLLQICQRLIEQHFADACGTRPGECADSGTEGCLQLGGADIVIGEGSVDSGTEDPPVDVAGLLDRLPFVDESDKRQLPATGVIIIGDPSADGGAHVEIDPEIADYDITDGEPGGASSTGTAAFDDEYFRNDVESFFGVMGIDPSQALFQITGVGSTSGDGTSTVQSKSVFVMREVNGIRVPSDQVIFNYGPGTGELTEIKGTWTRIDYANSQFDIDADSVDDVTSDLISRFEQIGVEPLALQDVIVFLSYRVDEATRTLDLMLQISAGVSTHDMDI